MHSVKCSAKANFAQWLRRVRRSSATQKSIAELAAIQQRKAVSASIAKRSQCTGMQNATRALSETSRLRPWVWLRSQKGNLSFTWICLGQKWIKEFIQISIEIPLPRCRRWFGLGVVLWFRTTCWNSNLLAHPTIQVRQFATIRAKRHVSGSHVSRKRTAASGAFRGEVWFRHSQRITNLVRMSLVTRAEFPIRNAISQKEQRAND